MEAKPVDDFLSLALVYDCFGSFGFCLETEAFVLHLGKNVWIDGVTVW